MMSGQLPLIQDSNPIREAALPGNVPFNRNNLHFVYTISCTNSNVQIPDFIIANKIVNNGQVFFMNQVQTLQLIQELLQTASHIDRNDYLEIGQSLSASKYIQTDALAVLDNQLDNIINTVIERSQSGRNSMVHSTIENCSYIQQIQNRSQMQHFNDIQTQEINTQKSYDTEMQALQNQLKQQQSQSQLIHETVAEQLSNPDPPRSKSQQKDIQDLLGEVQPDIMQSSVIHEQEKELLNEIEEKPIRLMSSKSTQRLDPINPSILKSSTKFTSQKSQTFKSISHDSQISEIEEKPPSKPTSKKQKTTQQLQRSSSDIFSNIETITTNDETFLKQKQEADKAFKQSLKLAEKTTKQIEYQEPALESLKEAEHSSSASSSFQNKDAIIRQLSMKAKLQNKIIKQLMNDNKHLQSYKEDDNDGLTAYERIARKYRSDNFKGLKRRSVLPESPYNNLNRFERNITEKKRFLRGIENFLQNLD